jgi:hypothetical protein
MVMLLGIFLYWHYFLKKKDKRKKIALIILSFFALYGLFILHSKAITITIILWIIMFSIFKKKTYILPAALLFLFSLNIITNNRIINDTNTLFSKESAYLRGEVERDRVLAGRGMIWRMYFTKWPGLPPIQKFIGNGSFHGYYHNDFIRILYTGGILLLGIYILLIITLSQRTINNFFKKKEFIHFVALLGIVYYFMESIGQLAGVYPYIMMVVFGIVGLSLNPGFEWENQKSSNAETNAVPYMFKNELRTTKNLS